MSDQNKRPTPPAGGPRRGPGRPIEKAKDFGGTMKKLLAYLKPYYAKMIVVLVLTLCSTVFAIIGPRILGNATDTIVDGITRQTIYTQIHENMGDYVAMLPKGTTLGQVLNMLPDDAKAQLGENLDMLKKHGDLDITVDKPGIDMEKVSAILLTLALLYGCSACFTYGQGFIMAGINQKITYDLRKNISEKIHRMPLKYYDSQTHGDVLSRITNDVDTVSTTLNQSLTQIVSSVATVLGVLYMMISISLWMTLIALVTLPITLKLVTTVIKKSQKFFRNQQKYLGEVNGQIEETYAGHLVISAFNRQEQSIEEFKEINEKLYNTAWKSQFLSGLMHPLSGLVGNVGYVAVCVLGGYLADGGAISVGNIQSFITYLRQFNQPVNQMASIANTLQSTAAAAERVFEFLDEAEEVPETSVPASVTDILGNVTFEHVKFGYDPDMVIIHDFSCTAKAGQRVAIVGPTGAGKTTLIKLLMRFYDVQEGSIKIDGVDIRDFTRKDLRDQFGMVLQDTWLYGGTIKENIRYGRPDATDEEVIAACKQAHAHSFIKQLPGGYNMVLNEEATNISQGQKQLLTIARAILSDPKILILDEATSSVDTRTEVRIQKGLGHLMEGRTSFIIAHRLSTIRDADLILVLNDGDVVEQGSHEELLEQKGFYYQLYNAQFERSAAN